MSFAGTSVPNSDGGGVGDDDGGDDDGGDDDGGGDDGGDGGDIHGGDGVGVVIMLALAVMTAMMTNPVVQKIKAHRSFSVCLFNNNPMRLAFLSQSTGGVELERWAPGFQKQSVGESGVWAPDLQSGAPGCRVGQAIPSGT